MNSPEPKNCLACGKTVKGRSDKKFCDDYCRNQFNNHQKGESNQLVRNINNTLRRNRYILQSLIPERGMIKVNRESLIQAGFSFKYHTHQYQNKKGNTYSFCYEYGYLPLDIDWYLIVKRNEN
jgi:predicted nucleic acid-binding Zn ribbon protein